VVSSVFSSVSLCPVVLSLVPKWPLVTDVSFILSLACPSPPSGQAMQHPISLTGSPALAWSSPYTPLVWLRLCLDWLSPSKTPCIQLTNHTNDGSSKYL
jgi:hypothetical protein